MTKFEINQLEQKFSQKIRNVLSYLRPQCKKMNRTICNLMLRASSTKEALNDDPKIRLRLKYISF